MDEVIPSRATGLRAKVLNGWHLYNNKCFSDLEKSNIVKGLLFAGCHVCNIAAFITGKYCCDRTLLRPGRFYTGQETCAAARSPTSAVEAPPPRCNYINKLPPANVEKCPIPFSINEILRCGVKVSWLGIFCILVFFAKDETWIHHFLPLWTRTCIRSSSELKFHPGCMWEVSGGNGHTKM